MADHDARVGRLADQIKVIIAQLLEKRIKDPRVGFVTITDVRVTGDMREANVFYTVLGDQPDQDATAAALESAKGLIRSEVGRVTGVRFTPFIHFHADKVPEEAARIDDLLRAARESDEQVARQASSAKPAGDPQPYRDQEETE